MLGFITPTRISVCIFYNSRKFEVKRILLDVLRREIKYVVSPCMTAVLKGRLSCVLLEDSHNGIAGYLVRSLYFDTPDSQDYYEKVFGLEYRKKVRLRVYSPDSRFAKLELKQKHGNQQHKQSLELTRQQAERVIAGDYDELGTMGEFGSYMAGLMKSETYRPVCMVEYNRYAYISATNDTRITFDSNLRSSESNFNLFDSDIQFTPVDTNGETTLEVKYNHFLLSYIKDAIRPMDMLSSSNSKYCRCRPFGITVN